MMQAMVLVGVLAICAVSGVLLTYRPRWTPGPEEPTGSYVVPPPPVPGPPPATVTPSPPPAAVAVPAKPSQPLPPAGAADPPTPALSAARRGRNSGFHRFSPAAPTPVRRITPGVTR